MQQPREILRKIRRLELQTRRLVNSSFAGRYHSVFKGRGMNFDEVREYAPGDEIRSIDWNVTARMNVPHVKKFVEERELTVMLLVDVSASGSFGSVHLSKRELGAEVASLLAFSAIQNNDKVGLILFSDHVELFIPPKKGRLHILRLIRETLFFEPKGMGTNLAIAFETLNRLISRRAVVFVLSDFIAADFSKQFAVTSKRHDVTAFPIFDPAETALPNIGIVTFEDAETGLQVDIDTSDSRAMARFLQLEEQRREQQQKQLRSYGVDIVSLRTDQDVLPPLRAFFEGRERRSATR
ncbi:MAG: DUF58 domain-containing protein [Verrucomicrobia bacterium]|nr:MAG: DUF58 domain-containing protein [Verrucomicrobiota bacterium]